MMDVEIQAQCLWSHYGVLVQVIAFETSLVSTAY